MLSNNSYLTTPLPMALLYLILAFTCFVLVSYTLYTTLLHPLARYPGPFLSKFTDLPTLTHALRGDRHLHFHRLHARYGPTVRYGPNSLSFNTSAALREIYGNPKANVRKARFYEAFWANQHAASTHSVIDKGIHARKRRVLSQAFSDAAGRAAERYVLVHVREFCGNLGRRVVEDDDAGREEKPDEVAAFGPPVNFADQANYLTFDTLGDLCFGKSFNMLSSAENRFAIDLIGSAARRHLICGTWLPLHTYHLDKVLFRKIAAGRERYMQYSRAQAAERMALSSPISSAADGGDVKEEERKDFFYHLLHAKDPATGQIGFPSPTELWAESNLLIIAGSDTTSTALAATVHYLLYTPRALQTLTREILTAFPTITTTVESLTAQTTSPSHLPYLRACLDEAMRLSPSVPGLLPREVLAGGATIAGIHVPAGTSVGVPHYALHRNEEYFYRVEEFWPERWLVGASVAGEVTTRDKVDMALAAFCPFSIGARGCIGKGLAYTQLSIALARVVFLFEMRLPEEPLAELTRASAGTVEYHLKDTFTSAKDGPMVRFRARAKVAAL